MEQTQTYEEAYKELTAIASEIENDTISVDQLAQKVKRASELIKICQSKLREAETEVNNIITQMDEADENKKK
ncbi:exodeoxyribonuclease VII small subunit [Flavobacterium sp.]|uniref:exodeoxyribonuclease VII small subunit n=1 Tax=Flavobacterium sp. TaxID=239 RepID=UPI004034B507